MATPWTRPGNPAAAGNPSNGSDDTPTLFAESTSSGEMGIVEHEITHPRDDCGEPAGPLAQCQVQDPGSPRKMTDATTDKPRTSQRLTTECASIPTIAKQPVLAGVPRGTGEENKACQPAGLTDNLRSSAPRDTSSSGVEIN